jgi:acyl-CoA thioester hydrolase
LPQFDNWVVRARSFRRPSREPTSPSQSNAAPGGFSLPPDRQCALCRSRPQQHVNNAVYATYFETGRVTLVKDRSFGLTPPGLGWMLVRLDIHFRAELRWPGSIEMGLGVAKFGRTSLTFDQVVFSDRKCVASAQSVTVLIDESTRKPTPLTGEIIGNFQRWLRRAVEGA